MSESAFGTPLGIERILQFLPHKSPFLLVDRILEIEIPGGVEGSEKGKVGSRVVGLKNFTVNEPFFPGHFPGFPVAPGVLLVECMAQVSCFVLYPALMREPEKIGHFQVILVGVDGARFRKPVVPGDTLIVESVLKKVKGPMLVFEVKGTVAGQAVVEAEIMASVTLRPHTGGDKK